MLKSYRRCCDDNFGINIEIRKKYIQEVYIQQGEGKVCYYNVSWTDTEITKFCPVIHFFSYGISKSTEYLIDVLRKELNFKLCSAGTDKSLKSIMQFTLAGCSKFLSLPLNFGDKPIQYVVQRKDGQGSPSYVQASIQPR